MQASSTLATINPIRVGIVGAAIAGPVLAIQLLTHPVLRKVFHPVLYDRTRGPTASPTDEVTNLQSGGAGIGLFGNGLYPLHQLGLADQLRTAGRESPELAFWRASYDGHYTHLSTVRRSGWAEDIQSHLLALERRALQSILVKRAAEAGGELYWQKALEGVHNVPENQVRLVFQDGTSDHVDLLVGADGAFSRVRKHILGTREPAIAEERWLPEFCGISYIYGVASESMKQRAAIAQTHGLWLDHGILSTSPLPDGKLRWDLLIPESGETPNELARDTKWAPASKWETKIVPGAYSPSYTASLLRKHLHVYHPSTQTFADMLSTSSRIIHTSPRQRAWHEDEIQNGNTVLIGDASRTLLPTSGQGTGFAIEDATVLANMLLKYAANAQRDDSKKAMGQALREYARRRVPRSKRMARVALSACMMATSETWYWRWIRDFSSWISGFGGAKSTDTWPFKDRYDVADDRSP